MTLLKTSDSSSLRTVFAGEVNMFSNGVSSTAITEYQFHTKYVLGSQIGPYVQPVLPTVKWNQCRSSALKWKSEAFKLQSRQIISRVARGHISFRAEVIVIRYLKKYHKFFFLYLKIDRVNKFCKQINSK